MDELKRILQRIRADKEIMSILRQRKYVCYEDDLEQICEGVQWILDEAVRKNPNEGNEIAEEILIKGKLSKGRLHNIL